jgi:hypothetical protein
MQSAAAENAVCLIIGICVLLGFLVMGGGLSPMSLGATQTDPRFE